MSVIIRLQNLPLTASSIDIRNFFHGLSIPDGGVHIVGGSEGDAFIAFSTDEDARQAMRLTGNQLKDCRVSLLLSSRNEMYKVIEQARLAAMGGPQNSSMSSASQSNMGNMNSSNHQNHSHMASHGSSSGLSGNLNHSHSHHQHQSSGLSGSSSMSSSATANEYMSLRGLSSNSNSNNGPADLSSNPALLFSTMAAIPSATLGGGNANTFLAQGQHFPGISTTQPNQTHTLQFGAGVGNSTASVPPPFPNGNPFLIPPPSLSGITLPFPGILPGSGSATGNNPLAGANASRGNAGMGFPPTTGAVLGLSSNVMNSTMSMTGHPPPPVPMNPFSNPPPRMSLMSNGIGTSGPPTMSTQTLTGGKGGGPRPNSSFASAFHSNMSGMGGVGGGGGMGGIGSGMGSMGGGGGMGSMGGGGGMGSMGGGGGMGSMGGGGGMGSMGGGGGMGGVGGGMNRDLGNNRQQQMTGPRPQFGGFGNNIAGKDRFQPTGGPPGRMENMNNRENPRDRRSRSRSRERREREQMSRRRRSRSRERDRGADRGAERGADRDRRRRRSRSPSNSRSRSRERAGAKASRRDSRDKREERRRSDSSPEKSSQEKSDTERRSRRDLEPSPVPNSMNTTTEEWPGVKLNGIPTDASYREIKEFIRVEVMGGSDGVVRLYDEGVAYLKLESGAEYPRVFLYNGRKLRGSVVTIEGITMETWTHEYKLNKSRIERDIDREKEERERERDRDNRPPRDRGDRDRSDRHNHNSHHRSSRFSNASQSSCIAIRGLAPTITRQEIITRYLHDSPCEDVVLIAAPTPTNRHSVTAFVQFESAQLAQNVIDSIARSSLGATLVVETCDVEDLQRAKARTSGSAPAATGGRDRDNRAPVPTGLAQDAKSIFELDLGLDDETTTVILKGAPPNITERDVFDFFSDIGLAPTSVKIMYDSDGQCSGQVICEFQDNNKAKRATTKDGMFFGRGQISVSMLPSRSSRSNNTSGDFGQLSFSRNNNPQQRPGLLGAGPRNSPGMTQNNTRFSNPTIPSSPNIFEQALQQQSGPIRTPLGGGRGGRGGANSGERMSRFNNSRNDFRGSGMGRGGRGGTFLNSNHNPKDENASMSEDDMALFNKKGCVLGLENIPYKASMDDILQYLEDILKIRIAPDRIIRRYDEMQKPTGDARVAFDTEFEAKLACERLNGTFMWKRTISADVVD